MNTRTALLWVAGSALFVAVDPGTMAAQDTLKLTLGDAARFAAEHGVGPEAARYRVDVADARFRQQRAGLLPKIDGTLGLSARTFNSAGLGLQIRDPSSGADLFAQMGEVLGPVRTWDVRATARQSLIDVAAFARIRAARADVAAADAEVMYASQQAAASAALAYLRAVSAEAQLAGRRQDSALAEELLTVAQRQREAGMSTTLDVARAQNQLAGARAHLISARAERERTWLELRRALGVSLDTPLFLVDSLAGAPTTLSSLPEVEIGDDAFQTRGELRMVEERVNAVQRQLAAIEAERLPIVSVFADGGRNGTGVGRLLHTYSWGVQVSVPLFDGLRREARMAERRSAARELDIRRRDLDDQIQFEIRDACLQVTSAEEQLAAAVEQLALADRELGLAKRRFTEGVAGNADVVTAQMGVTAARTQLVDARAAVQLAHIALARARGIVTSLP